MVTSIDRPLLLLVLLVLVMVTGIHRPLLLLALGVVSANHRPLMLRLRLLVLLDLELVLVLMVMLRLVLELFLLLLLLLLLRGLLLFSSRETAERRDVGVNHSINVCCAGILR
jgi:hypothetical protein